MWPLACASPFWLRPRRQTGEVATEGVGHSAVARFNTEELHLEEAAGRLFAEVPLAWLPGRLFSRKESGRLGLAA